MTEHPNLSLLVTMASVDLRTALDDAVIDVKSITATLLDPRRQQFPEGEDKCVAITAIEDYFKTMDADLSLEELKYDAQYIMNLFPFYSEDYITERLRILGNEKNRVNVVLRLLLAERRTTPLQEQKADLSRIKIELDEKFPQEQEIKKEIKTEVDEQQENESISEHENFQNDEDSLKYLERYCTQEVYADDFKNKPSTSKDYTINRPCVEDHENYFECQPSTSKDYTINIPCRSPQPATTVPSLLNCDVAFEKSAVRVKREPALKSEAKAINFKSEAAEASAVKGNFSDSEDLNINADEPGVIARYNLRGSKVAKKVNNSILRPAKFTLPETSIINYSLREDNSTEFSLIRYLKEMFENRSEQDIYVVCARHNADINKLPDGASLDLIVQELISDEVSNDAVNDAALLSANPTSNLADKTNLGEREVDNEVVMDVSPDADASNAEGNLTAEGDVIEEPPAAKKPRKTKETVPVYVTRSPIYLSDSDDDEINDDIEDLFPVEVDNVRMEEEAVAAAPTQAQEPVGAYDKKLYSKLSEIFTDACPIFIKKLCVGRSYTHEAVNEVTNHILSLPEYPKRKAKSPSPDPTWDPDTQLNTLKEILPDADPTYLQYHVELYGNDQEKLKSFIAEAIEKKNYPTLKEYLRKQQLSAQLKQYTTDFNVEKFLEVIPDPEKYFSDTQRKPTVTDAHGDLTFMYAFKFLKNMFLMLPIRLISTAFEKNGYNVMKTKKDLDQIVRSGSGVMKTKRKPTPIIETVHNIPFLQEIAYLQHQTEILEYIKKKEQRAKKERQKAKAAGLLQTCNCCYDDEVMPNCILTCENSCAFCKPCIARSVEIAFGEGKLDFPCLAECNSHFSLQTLQLVLTPKLFSKMAQKKQLEEVKAAGIEELEMCPFCDFATIPAPGDKLFKCLNPECMKESCRECKEPSHIPLRCDEIEKDDDVKRRVYIENKMTEALLRKCYKCGLKFIKADGCNKMTCSCGASMCYVCGKPVEDYKHFNGQGGDQHHLCPLYSDTNKLHEADVLRGADAAKEEIGVKQDPTKLKIDPTLDLRTHYRKERTRQPYEMPPGMIPNMGQPGANNDIVFHVRVNHNNVHIGPVRHHHHVYYDHMMNRRRR